MQVSEPEQLEGSGIEPISPAISDSESRASASMPIRVGNGATEDQHFELEGPSRHESTSDGLPPPLGVELTGYRLLNMSVVFAFCLAKGILTYKGQSAIPTTFDWVSGGVVAVILYWIGLYEPLHLKKWEWFFQVDLTRAICYCFLRFIGGVVGTILTLQGTVALSSVPVLLIAHFIPAHWHVSFDLGFVVFVLFTVCVHFILSKLKLLKRMLVVREARATQDMSFLGVYGLRAPLPEKYEWSGSVGVTLGFFCGNAIIFSPLAIFYFYVYGAKI